MSKKKRTKNKTYPRRTETRFKQPILVPDTRGLVVHIDGWGVTLKDKYGVPYPQSSFDSAMTYTGEHKTRVVTQAIGLEKGETCVGAWMKNFDVVYAADTNTKPIHGGKHQFSIGCVFKGIITQTHDNGGTLSPEPYAIYGWVWSGEPKIEQQTWIKAIQKIQAEEPENRRIAFVVDSDRGNLEAYCNRSKPLLKDFYLPSNFTLIYASADRSDEWPNQMIKRCDKLAGADLEKNLPVVEGIDENIPLQGEPLFFEVQIPSPKNTTT